MLRKLTILIFPIVFVSILVLLTGKTYANSTLFQDDFNDGDANGWEERLGPGGSWIVENGEYIGKVNRNSYGNSTYALAGDFTWSNYVLEARIKGISGIDKKLRFRYKNSKDYYELNFLSGGALAVIKVISGSARWTYFRSATTYQGFWYEVKVVLDGSRIQIYLDGERKFDLDDSTEPIPNGKIMLEVWPGQAAAQTTVAFDDVKVTSIDSSLLPVPYFSQRDQNWAEDKYDDADNWKKPWQGNTIEEWGCALTSGAMVARYFGINKTPDNKDLTPGTLNEWMSRQEDMNFRNGAMNWKLLANMTKFSATVSATPIPILNLSISDIPNNFAGLDEILQKATGGFPGLPGILQVPKPDSPSEMHFVVAKGKIESTHAINDPLAEDKDKLSIYKDEFNKLIWYEPVQNNLTAQNNSSTEIDLSTIFLVVDKNVSVEVRDQNGNQIGKQFDLYPLSSDSENGGTSGEILKMFYFDQPPSGNYTVRLSATDTQSYQLDAYLYDQNAEVKMFTIKGVVGQNDSDTVNLTFDSENSQNSQTSRVVSFETIKEDINSSYLLGWIPSKGLQNYLLHRVRAAQTFRQNGNVHASKNILTNLLNQVVAGREKHPELSDLLKADLEILLLQL